MRTVFRFRLYEPVQTTCLPPAARLLLCHPIICHHQTLEWASHHQVVIFHVRLSEHCLQPFILALVCLEGCWLSLSCSLIFFFSKLFLTFFYSFLCITFLLSLFFLLYFFFYTVSSSFFGYLHPSLNFITSRMYPAYEFHKCIFLASFNLNVSNPCSLKIWYLITLGFIVRSVNGWLVDYLCKFFLYRNYRVVTAKKRVAHSTGENTWFLKYKLHILKLKIFMKLKKIGPYYDLNISHTNSCTCV